MQMIAYVEKAIQIEDKGKLGFLHVNHGVMAIYCVSVGTLVISCMR